MIRLALSALMLMSIAGCNHATTPDATANSSSAPEKSTSATRTVSTAESAKKDNTVVNQRDRSSEVKTPIDQNENQKDIDVTANIRKRVVAAKMSSNAHNSKIITQDGKVTLRGPVASDEEKQQIEEIATDVAGAGNVDNQLEVQP